MILIPYPEDKDIEVEIEAFKLHHKLLYEIDLDTAILNLYLEKYNNNDPPCAESLTNDVIFHNIINPNLTIDQSFDEICL